MGASLPIDLSVTGGYATPTTIHVAGEAAPREGYDETSGRFQLRLEPTIIASGRVWPIFQLYQLKLGVEARYYVNDLHQSQVELADPISVLRASWGRTRLTEAYGLAAGEHLAVKVGLMRSHWGVGLLANDNRTPAATVASSPFGMSRWVDHVFRVQLAAFPLGQQRRRGTTRTPMTIALAADGTISGADAEWTLGDRTYTGIAAIKLDLGRFQGGLYLVYRHQAHAQGGRTEVGAWDFHGRLQLLKGPVKLWLQTEFAWIIGATDYAQSVFHEKGYEVFAMGGVGRLGLEWRWLEAVFEVGMGSGDDNPYDNKLTTFSFNASYRVGLLMFGSAGRIATSVSAFNIANPDYRERPPRGLERLAQRGAVQGATYINPRLGFKPVKGLMLMAGFLWATANSDYSDAFWSGLAGGAAVGPNGALSERVLGFEVDLGIRYEWRLSRATVTLRAEFAFFRPGPVFQQADGSPAQDQFGGWLHASAGF